MTAKCVTTTLLLILSPFAFCPVSRAEQFTPATFLERYREGAKAIAEAYGQSTINYHVKDTSYREKSEVTFAMVLKQSGKYCKLQRAISKTDAETENLKDLVVANPYISFMAHQSAGGWQQSIDYLSTRRGVGYEMTLSTAVGRSYLARALYSYFERPLIEFLTMKETAIKSVTEEVSDGRSLVRVRVRVAPFSDQLRAGPYDRLEGWFLLEPSAHWALRGFEVKEWFKDGKILDRITCSTDYDLDESGMPKLRRVLYDVYYKDRDEHLKQYAADVESIQFGPSPPADFTLEGCGLAGIFASQHPVPLTFYISLGFALVSVVAVFTLRRWPRRSSVSVT